MIPSGSRHGQVGRAIHSPNAVRVGAGRAAQVAIVDLHKRSDNHFELMDQYHGYLRTAWGNWRVDGVYRTRNGLYEWRYEGDVVVEERKNQ